MFNLFRHCRNDEISFDIVAETGNIVAENGNIVAETGNNVKATFDTVERIVQIVAFDNVASTLLLVWTALNGRDAPLSAVERGRRLPNLALLNVRTSSNARFLRPSPAFARFRSRSTAVNGRSENAT